MISTGTVIIYKTSSVTSVTEERSASARLFGGRRWHVVTTLCYVAIIFIGKCSVARFLCAMYVFEVWSSSSPRLPLCQISFLRSPLLS